MRDVESSEAVCSSGGAGEEDLETTPVEVPGGGAPLTSWSSFEADMNETALQQGCVPRAG